MAAITSAVTAVVATTAGIAGSQKQAKAAKKAAKGQEQAAIESAQFLADQGQRGQEAIRQAGIDAATTAGGIAQGAIDPLQRFAEAGRTGFDQFAQNTMTGGTSGFEQLMGNVSGAGLSAVGNQNLPPAMQAELARKAGISGQAAGRAMQSPLQSLAGMGVATAGDIAGIQGRSADRLADIATQTAAGRSAALVGAAPAAQQALLGAGEARQLGNFANQRFNTQALESLSRLAGELY